MSGRRGEELSLVVFERDEGVDCACRRGEGGVGSGAEEGMVGKKV